MLDYISTVLIKDKGIDSCSVEAGGLAFSAERNSSS